MSISMHFDDYLEERGISADDTVIPDNPCAVFDGNVENPEEDAKRRLEEATKAIEDLLK